MASEFTSEDSRWEITITVRPLAIRRMFSLTMASLSGSRALVASSRIKIFGSRISARRSRVSGAARQKDSAILRRYAFRNLAEVCQ